MMKLLGEAKLEAPYRSVNFWTYRLRTERIPTSYFDVDSLPRSYEEGNRTEGPFHWLCWMLGMESVAKVME